MQLHFEVADLRDREDVLVAVLLAAVDPGPHMAAHEADRLLDRAARNAGVDRRLNDLRHRAVRRGTLAAEIGRDHGLGPNADVVDQNVAARRRALAEARPIVDDRQSGRRARRDREMDIAVFVDRADVDEMGEQGAGRIELLAIDDEGSAIASHRRFEGADVLALGLRKGVAEAIALQRATKPQDAFALRSRSL